MLYALGVVGLVTALLVSVTLHEAGHFLTARRFGMKASRFFVGFGPTIWSFRRGETEYGFKAVPAGGFVKIVGMTQLEDVEPGDEKRAFWRFPSGQRAVVLAAGSFMHFVLAIVLVYGVTLAVGVADAGAPPLGTGSKCGPAQAGGPCADPGARSAPAAGNLLPDDRILAVNGQRVSTWTDVVRKVRAAPDETVTLTVRHGDDTRGVTLEPVAVTRPSLDHPNVSERV